MQNEITSANSYLLSQSTHTENHKNIKFIFAWKKSHVKEKRSKKGNWSVAEKHIKKRKLSHDFFAVSYYYPHKTSKQAWYYDKLMAVRGFLSSLHSAQRDALNYHKDCRMNLLHNFHNFEIISSPLWFRCFSHIIKTTCYHATFITPVKWLCM